MVERGDLLELFPMRTASIVSDKNKQVASSGKQRRATEWRKKGLGTRTLGQRPSVTTQCPWALERPPRRHEGAKLLEQGVRALTQSPSAGGHPGASGVDLTPKQIVDTFCVYFGQFLGPFKSNIKSFVEKSVYYEEVDQLFRWCLRFWLDEKKQFLLLEGGRTSQIQIN